MKWVGKTRTVRISTNHGDRTYHSIDDVPSELRQVVKQALEGPNSQTVLIANQEAYERLNEQLRELPAGLQELARATAEQREEQKGGASRLWKWAVAGSLSALLLLWLLWVWIIRSGTW
jgi:hypothetical protein